MDEVLDRSEKARRQICEAAALCFNAMGIARTTMTDIVRESTFSKPTVYAYFKNKEDVAASLLSMTILDWLRATAVARDEESDVIDLLRESFEKSYAFFQSKPVTREFMMKHPKLFEVGSDSPIEELVIKSNKSLRDLVLLGQKRGNIRNDCHAKDIAELLRITHVAVIRQSLRDGGLALFACSLNVLLEGLRPPAVAKEAGAKSKRAAARTSP